MGQRLMDRSEFWSKVLPVLQLAAVVAAIWFMLWRK
jgi:hypothetical protein